VPIEVLRVQDMRNYRAAERRPAPQTTVVWGENGSGKSTLLEAAGIFSTLSSARASSLKMVVRQGSDEAGAHLDSTEGGQLEWRVRTGRAMLRIGGSTAGAKDFLGRFRSVLFTPEDLDLVRGDPAGRRRALDDILTQLRPAYRAVRQDLERALRQRNAALREGLVSEARLYGEPLARAAAEVLERRRQLVAELDPLARDLYMEMAGRGELAISYQDSSSDEGSGGEELASRFAEIYERCLQTDLDRGRTTVGPHRDELQILTDGRETRWYASRGEQRTATLALRLAELRLLPGAVLLLDDVLSELDPERRRRVFEVARDRQTIVTATDPSVIPAEARVESTWRVTEGVLEEAA
jgi:DNA replication and repair protein RecF